MRRLLHQLDPVPTSSVTSSRRLSSEAHEAVNRGLVKCIPTPTLSHAHQKKKEMNKLTGKTFR